jgi:alkanesulfonate monooxygenase SsuD/methylene tetrahydromethanopterin reductase-like flavin-dependent oxidoreductase (luciferase family)
MKFGIFNIPYAAAYTEGKESVSDVIGRDLEYTRWAEQYGLDEAYYAEHYTLGNEPSPAPDLMIAAAAQMTERITLGAAAHLLPYHNPVALAYRMMWLDHMTGGRYIAGVAPGAYPSDAQLFGTGKQNPKMMIEALDIIDAILTREGPFSIEGEYYKVDMPAYQEAIHGPHLKPLQKRIPMTMTGMQATSPTLVEAGKRGFRPMSQMVHDSVLVQHWETYRDAAEAAGHTPDRSGWRINRNVIVADTDDEARRFVLEGGLGEHLTSKLIPAFRAVGLMGVLTGGAVSEEDVSAEWIMDNLLFVGSAETVAEKIRGLYDRVGGFGGLIFTTNDYRGDKKDAYRRSFELLGEKVIPALADIG